VFINSRRIRFIAVDKRATAEETILIERERREILRAMSIVRSTLMMSSNTKKVTAATV
jgi:hypothetical protein